MNQARYWLLTIPHANFTPYLPPQCNYIKGQLELAESGFLHWQVVVSFRRKVRLGGVRAVFGEYHAEATRSEAAVAYVWKEATSIGGTQFELGQAAIKRGNDKDWESIREAARTNQLDSIPADIYVRNYNSLKRIAMDHLAPAPIERTVVVYWGPTGVGKSRLAWEQAGMDAFPKDPRTKFWDGYRGHKNVVIDEFRGDIDISHVLRWFDRYPVIVEVKGSSTVLAANKIWITSNVSPESWYPLLDASTRAALMRRLEVHEMNGEVNVNPQ